MLVCAKCGSFFDEPKISYTMGGDTGEPWAVCPHCGCDELEEASRCAVCGECMVVNDMVNTGLCKHCYENGLNEQTMLSYITEVNAEEDFYLDTLMAEHKQKLLKFSKQYFATLPAEEREQILREYVELDKSSFGEYLEVKKNV